MWVWPSKCFCKSLSTDAPRPCQKMMEKELGSPWRIQLQVWINIGSIDRCPGAQGCWRKCQWQLRWHAGRRHVRPSGTWAKACCHTAVRLVWNHSRLNTGSWQGHLGVGTFSSGNLEVHRICSFHSTWHKFRAANDILQICWNWTCTSWLLDWAAASFTTRFWKWPLSFTPRASAKYSQPKVKFWSFWSGCMDQHMNQHAGKNLKVTCCWRQRASWNKFRFRSSTWQPFEPPMASPHRLPLLACNKLGV